MCILLQHSSPTDHWDGHINLNDDETSDEGMFTEYIYSFISVILQIINA